MKSILFFLFILIGSGAAAQQTSKVDGIWKMSVETSAGNGNPTFDLKQVSDTEITGMYKGQLGELPVKGKRDGNKIFLSFEVQGNIIEYAGTVDGDEMKGTVKLGTMGEGTFTGKRDKG